jgi:hypothetical protein
LRRAGAAVGYARAAGARIEGIGSRRAIDVSVRGWRIPRTRNVRTAVLGFGGVIHLSGPTVTSDGAVVVGATSARIRRGGIPPASRAIGSSRRARRASEQHDAHEWKAGGERGAATS